MPFVKLFVFLLKYPYCNCLGEHPRFGAMDVCPFTPVKNATMEDCVECANDLAKKLADELSVPSKYTTSSGVTAMSDASTST